MTAKSNDKPNPPVEDPRAIEEKLNALNGVLSSRIVVNRAGEILEIHAVASPGRHPKQILRDIESTLLAEEGIRIDRRKVSIAQLDSTPAVPAPATPATPATSTTVGHSRRLRFLKISSSLSPDGGEVDITLGKDNLQGFGKASFPLSSGSERAVAEATLRAVERFIRDGRFEVLEIDCRSVGSHRGVFVHVEHNISGRVTPLLGSALVQRDLNLAALHATLNAVNRFVGRLHPAEGVEWVAGSDTPPGPKQGA